MNRVYEIYHKWCINVGKSFCFRARKRKMRIKCCHSDVIHGYRDFLLTGASRSCIDTTLARNGNITDVEILSSPQSDIRYVWRSTLMAIGDDAASGLPHGVWVRPTSWMGCCVLHEGDPSVHEPAMTASRFEREKPGSVSIAGCRCLQ